jgi:hypothetical protein
MHAMSFLHRLSTSLDGGCLNGCLSTSEWDFSPLMQKDLNQMQRFELRAAIFYEYARESVSIRELAKQFSELPRPLRSRRWATHRSFTEELFFFTGLPFSHFVFWPQFFPTTPWLEIPRSRRETAVRRYIKRTTATLFDLKSYDEVRRWEVSDKEARRFTSSGI